MKDRFFLLVVSGVAAGVAIGDGTVAVRIAGEAVAFACAWMLGWSWPRPKLPGEPNEQ
mgnify:CR=1 FL=1|jgi:hypothetical protein